MTQDPNLAKIELIASALGPLRDQLVFVGGCAVGLLITDTAAAPVRVTFDVDLVARVSALAAYHGIEKEFVRLGFSRDSTSDAPICRWRYRGLEVDLMPTDSKVLGFANRWYPLAVETAQDVKLPSGTMIKLITAPAFLATIVRLAADSEESAARIDYLTDPSEAVKMLQRRISSIRNGKRFVNYGESGDLAAQIATIAADARCHRSDGSKRRSQDHFDYRSQRDRKTAAAVRRIPIHPVLRPLIDRLIATSNDGYLIPGLLTGGADSKRGHYLGKRFSHIRRKLGLDSPLTVFHSFRNALAQRCEDKEVPESTTELIGGWSRGRRMSYGLYSPGPSFETLRQAIAKVSYQEVDDLVRTLGARVEITKVSKRRVRSRADSAVPKHRHEH